MKFAFDWQAPAQSLVDLAIAALGGGGIVATINAVKNRRKVRVDAADQLNDSTLEWAKELQAESTKAKNEAEAARQKAHEAGLEVAKTLHEVALLRQQTHILAYRYQFLMTAIMGPNATIEALRLLVQSIPHEPDIHHAHEE